MPLSYVHGLVTHPDAREGLWGGIPEALRHLYSVSMILAAAGFFLFTGFILFRVDPEERNARFTVFPLLYALILIPSALWLPLTFAVMEHPSTSLWWAVRVDLLLVGLGSIGLFPARKTGSAFRSRPVRPHIFLFADRGPGCPCLAVLLPKGIVRLRNALTRHVGYVNPNTDTILGPYP